MPLYTNIHTNDLHLDLDTRLTLKKTHTHTYQTHTHSAKTHFQPHILSTSDVYSKLQIKISKQTCIVNYNQNKQTNMYSKLQSKQVKTMQTNMYSKLKSKQVNWSWTDNKVDQNFINNMYL